ncbi:MAG: SDR family NAD(P)-dependent oxidoreductase [Clostridia bacterium]|nr:SDR family NAD(P)-dependent oxidoreductase [Clostridia bacterium]
MNGTFKNKTVIVVGAGDEPCSEIAVALARQDACVLLIGQERDKLAAVQKRIQEIGGQARVYACDVNNTSALTQLSQEINDQFGCCECLINGSGREMKKIFSANTNIKIHAEGAYVASWIERRTDMPISTDQRDSRLYLCM